MSELMNGRVDRKNFRHRLLTSVSMLTLLALAIPSSKAAAGDSDANRPTVWIELGGQLENIDGQGEPFAPAFIAAYKSSPVFQPVSPLDAERPPKFAIGAESKISFEPADTDWVFSASVLYGRSNSDKQVHNQIVGVTPNGYVLPYDKFADTEALHSEAHSMVDFQAGKDLGLGMFGRDGKSVISLGVRFAQYSSRNHVDIHARPDLTTPAIFHLYFHNYTAAGQNRRSFHGVGPSLSWDASAPVAGSHDDGEIALDWGASVAVLFGRQKASEAHSTTAFFRHGKYNNHEILYQHASHGTRARSVTVPNFGGFAAVSFNYSIAKVSFGYRGDFFFGAVDVGWDTAHKENLSFHGPYATISVGLGD